MGRLATHLAVKAANVDNLPPTKQLEQISFLDALLPKSCATPTKKAQSKDEAPQTSSLPPQRKEESNCLQPQWCDVRRDFKGKKIIVAHKGPCYGNAPNDGGGGKGGTEDVKNGGNGNGEKKHHGAKNGGEGDGEKDPDAFTPEEDEKLKELKAEGKTWAHIAEVMGKPKGVLQPRFKIINPANNGGGDGAAKNGGGGDGGNKNKKGGEKQNGKGGDNKKEQKPAAAEEKKDEEPKKMTKAEKKAAAKVAKEAAAKDEQAKKEKKPKRNNGGGEKKAASKPASKSGSDARFTMGEWLTLQEDDIFSFGELQLLSELIAKYDTDRWSLIASRFFDETGRRVHPDDVRDKFVALA